MQKDNVFDQAAQTWDQKPDRQKGAEVNVTTVQKHLNIPEDSVILDFGCGTGVLGLKFLPKVQKVLFCDISEGMLGEVHKKITANHLEDRTAAFKWPEEQTKIALYHPNLVVSQMVLHHVEDLKTTAHQLFSILVENGKIALIDLDPEDGSFHNGTHKGRLGIDHTELQEALSQAGFGDIRFFEAEPILRNDRSYSRFLCIATKSTENTK